jgi:hypothetical protein
VEGKPGGPATAPTSSAADAQRRARELQAVQLEVLRQRQAANQATLRELSDLQSRHHELMMQIIGNIRPTGRYEYNPATGRYDRFVPDPRR